MIIVVQIGEHKDKLSKWNNKKYSNVSSLGGGTKPNKGGMNEEYGGK